MTEPRPLHGLKIWPIWYEAVESGAKTHEVRRDDRGYKLGDLLELREWNPRRKKYTGRSLTAEVTHVLEGALELGVLPGFVVLSIKLVGMMDEKGEP